MVSNIVSAKYYVCQYPDGGFMSLAHEMSPENVGQGIGGFCAAYTLSVNDFGKQKMEQLIEVFKSKNLKLIIINATISY